MKINIKLKNWNETINACRYNKFGANTIKQKEMKAIEPYLKDMKIVKNYPVEIYCKWHIKNSLRDLDNCSLKSVLDQMQKMGILENDNIKHINKITYEAIKDKEEYLDIEIVEKN